MRNTTTIYDGGAEYSADSAAPSHDDTPVHRQCSTTTIYDGGFEYSADSAAPSDDDTPVHRQCSTTTIYDGGAEYSADSAAPSDDDTPVHRQCSTTTIYDGGAEYSADSAAPSDDNTLIRHQCSATTIYDGGAEYSADSAAPSDDGTPAHRQRSATTIYDGSAEYSADSAAPSDDNTLVHHQCSAITIYDGGAEYSADSAAPSDDDTLVHRQCSAATTYDRGAEYSADSAPPTGDCSSVYRQCGAVTTYDYSAAPAADEPGIPSEMQQLATSLREMGQNIVQGSHQNINHLTQATADQARILGYETQETVDTTLSDQHQRYLDATKRVEQNIGIINDQYLGATQRQGRRIDQVASLIEATEKNLEERMERMQRDIQAHAQTVARVHRSSQQQTDTRPDTTTQKAPAAANYVPRRRPQITGQTRSNPMQPTGIDPPPNQSAKAVPSQATHQASPNEQPHRNPPDAPQSTPKAPPSTSSTTDEEPLPPLAGKELWQGTEMVWKMTGTFTPKGTDYNERKGKQCEEFPSFAKRFEHMAKFYEIPRANWAQMFAACLATSAHDEYLAMSEEQQNDFDQTIAHLGKIYPAPMRNEWTYRIQWDALRQGQDEPLRDFVGRIESLAHKAHTSLNPRGLEFEKIMKFRHGLASSFLRYDLAIVTAQTLQELGERAIMIQLKRNSDPATMWARTTEASEVARDLGTTPISIARTAQFEPQQHPMGEVTRLPYAYPHIMPPATTCVTHVPASSFAVPATPPPPTPSYNPPTQPPPGHPQGSEQRRQQPKDEAYPKKRRGDYQRGMDLASVQCYNCGERGHLASKCPQPDKRLRPGYRGGNRGRRSRGGNRANSHTDNRQSSDAHTLPASTSEPQNVSSTEQLSATQDPTGMQYRAQGEPMNADLDLSMGDVGFDPLVRGGSRRAMIRFASADLTSSRSKSPSMHTQALTTEEETEQFKKLLVKQEKAAPAPPSTVPEPVRAWESYDGLEEPRKQFKENPPPKSAPSSQVVRMNFHHTTGAVKGRMTDVIRTLLYTDDSIENFIQLSGFSALNAYQVICRIPGVPVVPGACGPEFQRPRDPGPAQLLRPAGHGQTPFEAYVWPRHPPKSSPPPVRLSQSTSRVPVSESRVAEIPKSITAKSKKFLASFTCEGESSGSACGDGLKFRHLTCKFLKPERIRDAQKRQPDDPAYDGCTPFVPADFAKAQTPAHKQWWEFKSKHCDSVLFFKVGKFYELYHMDAVTGVNELSLNYMKGNYAHSKFPEIVYDKFAEILVGKGDKVARIEQTETPQMLEERMQKTPSGKAKEKGVKRESRRMTTPATQTYLGTDGHTGARPMSSYLIAIKDNLNSTFGVCITDTAIGSIQVGRFGDDKQCSRLRTTLTHYPPKQIPVERGRQSVVLTNVLRTIGCATEVLAPKSQFLTSEETFKILTSSGYFSEFPTALKEMHGDDVLGISGKSELELAESAFGTALWYLKECLIDMDILSVGNVAAFVPIDVQPDRPVLDLPQHMVIDDTALQIPNITCVGANITCVSHQFPTPGGIGAGCQLGCQGNHSGYRLLRLSMGVPPLSRTILTP